MTKRIATTLLNDFTRRDFLVSSALTAALFAAALLLFPANHQTGGKSPQVTAQVPGSPR
ncbi:twin-arginine translocation signal domain-containing protein [Mesorhizobium sp. B2-6-2]|uniref:twin-arginine translocation signal domain-containing protein n=1 Tax=Mesorhizobium sp. B2-6-2 TaxID=2589915 RepID=UPI00112ACCBC|nr:twin-arginine translocation signal domain-containing protein [Mesorhizobium sp. B2-6-2]TPJ80973.1 twin-arginine translocation signal domain-containing protein [Mesorhizobium sp. B2-6-2]